MVPLDFPHNAKIHITTRDVLHGRWPSFPQTLRSAKINSPNLAATSLSLGFGSASSSSTELPSENHYLTDGFGFVKP